MLTPLSLPDGVRTCCWQRQLGINCQHSAHWPNVEACCFSQSSVFSQKRNEEALLFEDCLSIQWHFLSLPALFLVGKTSVDLALHATILHTIVSGCALSSKHCHRHGHSSFTKIKKQVDVCSADDVPTNSSWRSHKQAGNHKHITLFITYYL